MPLIDQFRAYSQDRQLLVLGGGVAAISVVLGLLWWVFFHTAYETLFTDLRTTDAATIVAELDKKKIPYRLAEGGTTILVPDTQVDATRLAVMSEDIPLKGNVGFELFNKSDMGLTDFTQKINYQRALQGELARTIMTLDGVDSARVHLSLGEDRIFRDDRVPPKASVTIRMKKGTSLTPSAAQGMRRLVAAAVPNLDIANVVVLDEEGHVVSAAPQTSIVPAGSPLAQEKQAIEQYYNARIRQALALANLGEAIGVSVWADVAVENGREQTNTLPTWSPLNRTFPLQVTLSPATPFSTEAEEFARTAVVQAIATTVAQDDVIAFGAEATPAPGAPFVPSRYHPAAVQIDAPLPVEDRTWLWEMVSAALVLALIVAVPLMLLRRMPQPRRMSPRQRADFAAKLQLVLAKAEGDLVSGS